MLNYTVIALSLFIAVVPAIASGVNTGPDEIPHLKNFHFFHEPKDTSEKKSEIPPLRVLIAEDNSLVQLVLRNLVKSVALETQVNTSLTVANNGKVAEQEFLSKSQISGQKYNVVITDYSMPEENGEQLAEAIRNSPRGKKDSFELILQTDEETVHKRHSGELKPVTMDTEDPSLSKNSFLQDSPRENKDIPLFNVAFLKANVKGLKEELIKIATSYKERKLKK